MRFYSGLVKDYGKNKLRLPIKLPPESKFDAFIFYCRGCGFHAGVYMNLEAALCGWHRANTPADPFYANRWLQEYEKMQAENYEI